MLSGGNSIYRLELLRLIYDNGNYDQLNNIILNVLGLKNVFVSYLYECMRADRYSYWSSKQVNCWKATETKNMNIISSVATDNPVFTGHPQHELTFSIYCHPFDKYLFNSFLVNKDYKDLLGISDKEFIELEKAITDINIYISKCETGVFLVIIYEGIATRFGDFGNAFTFESLLFGIKFIQALVLDKEVNKYAYKDDNSLRLIWGYHSNGYYQYDNVFKSETKEGNGDF